MMNFRNQRGEGRMGFLVSLVVIGLVAFLGIKIIPVRINAYNFRDTVREECRMGAVRTSDSAVTQRILDAADDMEIPLDKKDLNVRRTKGKMIITASYEQPIDLKFTTYVYRFNTKAEAPLF